MGYLLIDTRVADGQYQEYDTVSCKHCRTILKILQGQTSGTFCLPCMGPICEGCAANGTCEPARRRHRAFLARIEQQLARQAFWRRWKEP